MQPHSSNVYILNIGGKNLRLCIGSKIWGIEMKGNFMRQNIVLPSKLLLIWMTPLFHMK